MTNKLTASEFATRVAQLNVGIPFELAPDLIVNVRGVTEAEFLIHLVRRFPNLANQFIMSPQEEAKAKKKAAQGIVSTETPEQKISAYLREQLQFAPELKAAFSAITIDYPGDETVEKALLRLPVDKRDALLKLGAEQTWKDDFEGFLARVGSEAVGLEAMAMMTGGGTTTNDETSPETSSSVSESSATA